jgi:hypothetical protein
MSDILHLTSGECAGERLEKSGLPGEVLVWHDILYDGPRSPGWPDAETLNRRAVFLEETTAGGLQRQHVLQTLRHQYQKLVKAIQDNHILFWFDACLFDQSMLVHILACLRHRSPRGAKLLCIDAFPGIEPFHGLGQLRPDQMASLYARRQPVTEAQFQFAVEVDRAFAAQDFGALTTLSHATNVLFLREAKLISTLFGIPGSLYPDNGPVFEAYMAHLVGKHTLNVTSSARRIYWNLLIGTRLPRLLSPFNYAIAAMLLSWRIANEFGLKRNFGVRSLFDAIVGTTRLLVRLIPRWSRGVPAARRREHLDWPEQ